MKNFIKNNYIAFALILLVIFANIIFVNMPLLNILSYESSLLNAVLLSIIIGIYWLKYSEEVPLTNPFSFGVVILTFPLLILIISTALCQQCPLGDGIFFYTVFVIPSMFFGVFISEFSKFMSREYKYFIFVFLWLVALLSFLPELILNPQIYFYNAIFGYYPGVIYDENIEISSTLLYYRVIVLILSILGIIILKYFSTQKGNKKTAIVLVIILAYLFSGYLKDWAKLTTDLERIKSELNEEYKSEHFNLIYPQKLSPKEKIKLILKHEYYYDVLSKKLNVEFDEKITSIVFENGEQKKKLFGAENADVTKPWLNQMYMSFATYERTLKHELSHVFSAKFSDNFLNLPPMFNPAMIEGFAMMLDPYYDEQSIDDLAAIANKNGNKVSFVNLFENLGFFASASSTTYIYAGAFLKYLEKRFGIEKIEALYESGEFENVFYKSLAELEKDYLVYLETYEVDFNPHEANFYFGRLPLVKKVCARATAIELEKARNLYREEKYVKAENVFQNIYDYSGSYTSLFGYALSLMKQEKYVHAKRVLNNELNNFENTAYFYSIEALLGDLNVFTNDVINASYIYNDLIEQNPTYAYKNSSLLKLDVINDNIENAKRFIQDNKFYNHIVSQLFIRDMNDANTQAFIKNRNISFTDYQKSAEFIRNNPQQDSLNFRTFSRLSDYSLSFFDYENAKYFIEKALAKSDDQLKLFLNEKSEFIDFMKNGESKIKL